MFYMSFLSCSHDVCFSTCTDKDWRIADHPSAAAIVSKQLVTYLYRNGGIRRALFLRLFFSFLVFSVCTLVFKPFVLDFVWEFHTERFYRKNYPLYFVIILIFASSLPSQNELNDGTSLWCWIVDSCGVGSCIYEFNNLNVLDESVRSGLSASVCISQVFSILGSSPWVPWMAGSCWRWIQRLACDGI